MQDDSAEKQEENVTQKRSTPSVEEKENAPIKQAKLDAQTEGQNAALPNKSSTPALDAVPKSPLGERNNIMIETS